MEILIQIFKGILSKLPPETVKLALDRALDAIEESIAKSSTKIDDNFVLPAIKWLREQLGIVENPGSIFADPLPPTTEGNNTSGT